MLCPLPPMADWAAASVAQGLAGAGTRDRLGTQGLGPSPFPAASPLAAPLRMSAEDWGGAGTLAGAAGHGMILLALAPLPSLASTSVLQRAATALCLGAQAPHTILLGWELLALLAVQEEMGWW